jgi:hypothetical protein
VAGVEIQCKDCHGTADKYPTCAPPARWQPAGRDLALIRNPDGKKRFEWVGGKLIQRSAVTPGTSNGKMSLVKDVANDGGPGLQRQGRPRPHHVEPDTRP